MGKSQLCKLFNDYTGQSPIEYYSKLKMAEAKKLLIEDSLSVSSVSDILGYSSVHNFSRAFKKAYSFSPAYYREKINHIKEL